MELLKVHNFFLLTPNCIKLSKNSNWDMRSNITLGWLQMGFYIIHTLILPRHKNKSRVKYLADAYSNSGNHPRAQICHLNPLRWPHLLPNNHHMILLLFSPTPGMVLLLSSKSKMSVLILLDSYLSLTAKHDEFFITSSGSSHLSLP